MTFTQLIDQIQAIKSTRNEKLVLLYLLWLSIEIEIIQSAQDVLIKCVKIPVLIGFS